MNKISINIQRVDNSVANGKISYKKTISSSSPSDKRDDNAYNLELSKEGILHNEKKQKTSGITSTREAFEDAAAAVKKQSANENNIGRYDEIWRLDEPETYNQWVDALDKLSETRKHEENGLIRYDPITSWDDLSDDGKYYQLLASSLSNDWLSRRYWSSDAQGIKDAELIQNKIDEMEQMYSDKIHDVSFNLFSNEASNYRLWFNNTKFSIMLSKDMFTTLTSGKKESIDLLMSRINESVRELKNTELKYEGNHDWLRFGLKLFDDGSVTYHANYYGCPSKDGIATNSAEDLLYQLSIN